MSNTVSGVQDSSLENKIIRSILNTNSNCDQDKNEDNRKHYHHFEVEVNNESTTDDSKQFSNHQNACVLFPQVLHIPDKEFKHSIWRHLIY
jgi:hypothetical protein